MQKMFCDVGILFSVVSFMIKGCCSAGKTLYLDNRINECLFLFPSCWKGADWSEGPRSHVANQPATCSDMTKSPRMWLQGAASPNRAHPPPFPTPQRRTITAARISPLLSASRLSESRKNPSTLPTMWRSWTRNLLRLRPNTSKMETRSTLELSSVSRPHPVSYLNRPVTGSEKTSLSRATKAESKWLFT